MRRKTPDPPIVAAISGGPDSMFLLDRLARGRGRKVLVGHVNHGLRGRESDRDEILVEESARRYEFDIRIKRANLGKIRSGMEAACREVRHGFLEELTRETGGVLATAHTADDQVETILMRFFEGAGIAGLKGVPANPSGRIIRPIIELWKEDIVDYLKRNFIPFRLDRSNRDCTPERNWIRNVLIPLLMKRYGKGVKKRIFVLGERFRELDDYLDREAGLWIRRNVRKTDLSAVFRRKGYSALPMVLRIRILQKICFSLQKSSPNERLLASMDKSIRAGKPSNRVNAGGGWELANRYEEVRFAASGKPAPGTGDLRVEDAGGMPPEKARRIASRGNAEVFDGETLRLPLSVRPLRQGDRILPFGQTGEKKLKEILIDRKVPREERWGRPVVCDAEGTILWVPGVLRSGHAPVTRSTRCVKILRYSA